MSIKNTAGSTPIDLKFMNRQEVLNILKDGSSYTSTEIAGKIGLSRQTVQKALDFFIAKGLVQSIGKGDSTMVGGRKPEQYELSRNPRFLYINIDIGHVSLRMFDLFMNELMYEHHDVDLQLLPADDFWVLLKKLSEKFLEALQAPLHLYGVTATVRGLLNHETGTLNYSPFFLNWPHDISIRQRLKELFPDAEYINIDKPAQLVARSWYFENRENYSDKNILVISQKYSTGALIEHGRFLSSPNSLSGEIGHISINALNGPKCICGRNGCFGTYTSPAAILNMIAKKKEEYPDSPLHGSDIDPDNLIVRLFEYSQNKDPLAQKLSSYLGRMYGLMILSLSVVFDTDTVVLAGRIGHADSCFIDAFHKEFKTSKHYPEGFRMELICDKRRTDTMLFPGAASALLRQFFSDPNLYLDEE